MGNILRKAALGRWPVLLGILAASALIVSSTAIIPSALGGLLPGVGGGAVSAPSLCAAYRRLSGPAFWSGRSTGCCCCPSCR
jgi:hypothetical protein